MSMQDQHVRQSCNAIAGQIFLLAPSPAGTHRAKDSNSGNNTSPTNLASSSTTSNAVSTQNAVSAAIRSSGSAVGHNIGAARNDDRGAEELRRVCEAIVRDAMTLYRLCHRQGGIGVAIVQGSSGSSGGGGGGSGGVSGAVEEAAYCVCAAIMAREAALWASLARRAQLLRPRKPTLCFVPPVVVAPVAVKDIVRFFGRSRHLFPKNGASSNVGAVSSPSFVSTVPSTATTALPGPPAAHAIEGTSAGCELTAQQAEAVAAAFFFKTMSALERQRRPEVFDIQVPSSPLSLGVGTGSASSGRQRHPAPSTETNRKAEASTRSSARNALPAALPPLFSSVMSTRKGRGLPGHATIDNSTSGMSMQQLQQQQQQRRPSALLAHPSTSLLLSDDWNGWGGGGSLGTHAVDGVTGLAGAITSNTVANGVWSPSSNSSSSSSRSSVGRDGHLPASSDSGGSEGGPHAQDVASVDASPRREKRAKAAATAEAAVLERLYRLATTADAAAAHNEEDGDDEDSTDGNADHCQGGGSSSFSGAGAAMSSSLFTSGKGLGLVSLAAMTTQVQDALHWGRLTALVRFPILFRGLSPQPMTAPTTPAIAKLFNTSEALTAASMARMSDMLGSSYTSTSTSASLLSAVSVAAAEDKRDALDAFTMAYGSPGSFLCPSRFRTSSLLPRPPSLVTDTFLWTRLVICSAWLRVYADSLFDNIGAPDDEESSRESSEVDGHVRGKSTLMRPGVRPSPAVQEVIAFCIAVVKEARAISAGMTGECSSTSFSSDHHHHTNNNITSSNSGAGVCCPVCDCLVKENQPLLWWSTLRGDRALLRAQVRTLLENSSTTDSEAQVATAVAADGLREGRGGRQYAAPQLRGSGGAGERVAALQEQWGAFIMGGQGAAVPTSTPGAMHQEARISASALDDIRGPASKDDGGAADLHRNEGDHSSAGEATEALWAALTQRVAATADLCTFLSIHRVSDTHPTADRAALSRRTSAPAALPTRPRHRSGRAMAAGVGAGVRKRGRRCVSADTSEEEEDEDTDTSSGDCDEDSDAHQRTRRHADLRHRQSLEADSAESEEGDANSDDTSESSSASAESDESDGDSDEVPERRSGKRPRRSMQDEVHHESQLAHHGKRRNTHAQQRASPTGAGGDEAASALAGTRASGTPHPFQGSRHAHDVSEEWERLLRRCGWVNAAPPRTASTSGAISHGTSSVYGQWAASLILPSAIPNSQQAAVLRRRLSRYSLDDVARVLVLGRGGKGSQYAALLFGTDAQPRGVLASAKQEPLFVGVRSSIKRSPSLPHSGRATSMSLLEDNAEAALAERRQAQEVSHALGVAGEAKTSESQQLTRLSPSPPQMTSPASFAPLSPPPSLRHLAGKSTLMLTAEALSSPPTRKPALPSIPLHVSPLKRHAGTKEKGGLVQGQNSMADATRAGTVHGAVVKEEETLRKLTTVSPSGNAPLRSDAALCPPLARTPENQPSLGPCCSHGSSPHSALKKGTSSSTAAAAAAAFCSSEEAALMDGVATRSQLCAQQKAIRALLAFRPCFPPLREEDAVLECGACFTLFHQDCIAPVQRDLMGQLFLCHTCRLKWARPYVEKMGAAGGGLVHQEQAHPSC